ncbi:ATP-binding protein [Winogradskyella luteola]|uniref:ATP-binding protein n=1 Tax=Winogradskyella luteola TaxID=2828330 RepID=A0A9X1F9S8_9FLAO|nr:ATP-binding protein [Winogradskyella luteola]MBV7270152.1 ATP-binding protein [Winogradskyella luteola]
MSNFEVLPINADRICEAISKIGYKPSSAILDIVDNSVMANANNITIELHIKDGKSLNNIQNIEKIRIVDDGTGMNVEEIKKALELGSDVQYSQNSLSKYGLGLKSAGFSLGNRVEVTSKQKDVISDTFFLDREIIRENNKFGYSTTLSSDIIQDKLNKAETGTIVTISDIIYTSRVSANKIITDIAQKAGVSYYEYLSKEGRHFKVKIIKSKEGIESVEKERLINPKDILFWDECYESFKKESYDCKKPCKALESEFENPLNPEGENIKIQVAVFPKDSMRNFVGFDENEQKNIKKYEVGQKNAGFYFYRNGRLIKWGDKLFIGRGELGFRAKILFTSEHDDLFDVDVSKQHLTISEEIEKILMTLVSVARGQSKDVFKKCDELLKTSRNNGNEGAEFNVKNSVLEEEEEEGVDIDPEQVKNRKELLESKSDELNLEDDSKYEDEEDKEAFRRVRYWEQGRNLWESATDRLEGTYVLINRLHPFYDLVLSKLEKGSPERQSIEALFHALAVGENQTIQKFQNIDAEVAVNVFNKFSRSSSHQVDNWVNNNWSLFEDED